MTAAARWLALVGVCGVVLFLPLAKGGNTDWARGVAVMAVPAVFALSWPWLAPGSHGNGAATWPWLLVWAAVSVVIGVQLLPGSGSWFGPSPAASCAAQGVCEELRVTPFPMATASHWAMFSIYWMTAWMVSTLERRQVRLLVAVIALLALFEALYGLVAYVGGQKTILGIWEKVSYLTDVTGSFVNRNHFSGFLELAWPIGLSLILLPERKGGFRWPRSVGYAVAGLFSLVLGLAILNSHSRMGTTSAIVGLLTWSLLLRRNDEALGLEIPRWVGWAAVTAALVGGLWFGLEPLITRFSELAEAEGRFRIWSALLTLPLSTWMTGIGAGAFIDVFRTVQPTEMEPLFHYAHSDIMEFFLDFGLLGAASILLASIIWGRAVLRGGLSMLQIGALAGIAAIVFHSFADFNLHISGVAIVFWTAVGIVANPALRRRRVDRRGGSLDKER